MLNPNQTKYKQCFCLIGRSRSWLKHTRSEEFEVAGEREGAPTPLRSESAVISTRWSEVFDRGVGGFIGPAVLGFDAHGPGIATALLALMLRISTVPVATIDDIDETMIDVGVLLVGTPIAWVAVWWCWKTEGRAAHAAAWLEALEDGLSLDVRGSRRRERLFRRAMAPDLDE